MIDRENALEMRRNKFRVCLSAQMRVLADHVLCSRIWATNEKVSASEHGVPGRRPLTVPTLTQGHGNEAYVKACGQGDAASRLVL